MRTPGLALDIVFTKSFYTFATCQITVMLEKEFKYYLDNQAELVKRYNHRFIVVVGEDVVGDYSTFEEAVETASAHFEPGTFLVQECTEGDGHTAGVNQRKWI